jgi:3-dehydroquinate synthase
MKKITVGLGNRSYEILVGYKIAEQLGSILEKLNIGQDAVIITNPTIYHLYGGHLQSILSRSGFSTRFKLVPDSEKSKSERVCFDLINKIAAYDVRKRIFIVAFGGGVIGDLAGFIASVYKRGVGYIQIPTTFLAQVDSAIGGKTGIDLTVGKNLIGSFYQPRLVLSDLSFLRTLSLKQIRNGLAEAIKYGVIKDSALFEYIEKNYKAIIQLNIESIKKIVYISSQIKAKIVEQDETEKTGRRAILNFGHTIGHAIEAAAGFTKDYSHGEAVAIGMVCAANISQNLGLLAARDAKRVENILTKVGLPTFCAGLRLADILHAQLHDKKFIHGKNRFVLPKKIGSVTIKEDIPIKVIENVLKRRVR